MNRDIRWIGVFIPLGIFLPLCSWKEADILFEEKTPHLTFTELNYSPRYRANGVIPTLFTIGQEGCLNENIQERRNYD